MSGSGTAGKSFGWNAVALLVGQVSSPLLNAALVILMGRWLGPGPLGTYTLLVTVFLVLDQLRLLGMHRYVMREIALRGTADVDAYRGFQVLANAGTLVAVVLLAAYGWQVGTGLAVALAFAVAFAPSAVVWGNDAVFLGLGRADYTARLVLFESVLRMAGSLTVLWLWGADLVALGLVYSASRSAAAIQGLRYRKRLVGVSAGAPDWGAARGLLPEIPAFFAVTALPLVLLRADLLVIGWIGSPTEVGLYSAAARLVALALLVPDSLMLANFVRVARELGQRGGRGVRYEIKLVIAVCAVTLVPCAAAGTLVADDLVRLLFGELFTGGGVYFAWLIWSVPLFVASRAVGDALIAAGHQRTMAKVIVATTLTSVPVYVASTATFGPIGTAAAYVMSVVVLLTLSGWAAQRVLAPGVSHGRAWPLAVEGSGVTLETK